MKKFGKRLFSLVLFIVLVMPLFVPAFSVQAANPYSVVMVTNTSNNQVVGTYSNYSDAVKAMNAQNSTSTSVASIYKNGKIINSRYAIFRFNANSGTINLYQNASDSSAYTYTNPSSMTDTAFIDSNESRVQIMLNGFKGWADINTGNIIPISLLGSNAVNITASGLNLRSNHSTSSSSLASITCTNTIFTYTEKVSDGGYTWYKVNYSGKTGWVASGSWLKETTGNTLNTYYYNWDNSTLLHRYAYHNGTGYVDYFTNLGPVPSYLMEGVHYYSFDGGIYLYTTLTSMLDDYRNNDYVHSLNYNNPNYAYYLYLPSKSVSKVTASALDSQITNTSSKLYGQGKYFKEAEELYGMNALSAFATAKNESASGTSQIAKDKNNVFGYGASDSCPYSCAKSYSSVRESILDYAKNGLTSYMIGEAKYYFGTHAGTKGSGRNVKYASDPLWGEKQAWNAFLADREQSLRDYKANTIAVSKYGKYNLPVYKDTNSNQVIYYMRNNNSSFKVYNVPVTVLDKVGDYYKIYADSSTYQCGYVKVSDFNITNNQPVINANDKTINKNTNFNYLDGISASDSEDGNLTSKLSYSGFVDSSKAGAYDITYKVTDNSNFSASKTITVTVKGDPEPVIEASDKEVTENTDFDYLDGIKATDDVDGDITSKVTYEGAVDTSKTGSYDITYKVTNSSDKTTSKKITIKVVPDEQPVIEASDKKVYLNKEFNALDGVSATDKEDGDITNKIEIISNNVDTTKEGTYEVTFKVSDSTNQIVTKTIKVTVEEKQLEEKNGWFHLESLSFEADNLKISGYNVIKDIDNLKTDSINHKIVFENQDTKEVKSFNIDRWLDNIPYAPIDKSKKDYSGSWFSGSVNLANIKQGDYTIYIISESDDYYIKQIVSNAEYTNDIQRKYKDSNNRGYMVKENPSLATVDLELFVRDDGLISYEIAPVRNGLLSNFYSYSFENSNLNIVGNSYTLKTNYTKTSNVEREIILEDKETHKIVYKKATDFVSGPYKITSITKNDLTNAWFEATINLGDLDPGTYIIYLKTKSDGIEDYGELVDYAYSDLSSKTNINGHTVKLIRNNKQRTRLEIEIK